MRSDYPDCTPYWARLYVPQWIDIKGIKKLHNNPPDLRGPYMPKGYICQWVSPENEDAKEDQGLQR